MICHSHHPIVEGWDFVLPISHFLPHEYHCIPPPTTLQPQLQLSYIGAHSESLLAYDYTGMMLDLNFD
ncbi:MAG: hypothetical protein UY04_C0065G0002 [Parcubacteria group bacterium GW2011_GWA2_47_7]|nr:MAG: hypothetical protein UY04_C0065G0002 [Parcubacteria group bacterium GW2011_GWA2_47_7]